MVSRRNEARTSGYDVRVIFGPEMKAALARLEQVMAERPGLDADMQDFVSDLRKGKTIPGLLIAYHHVAVACTAYAERFNDDIVREALSDVIAPIMEQKGNAPDAVFVERQDKQRGR